MFPYTDSVLTQHNSDYHKNVVPKTQVFWDDMPCCTVTSWHSRTSTTLEFPAAPLWEAQISLFTKILAPFLLLLH